MIVIVMCHPLAEKHVRTDMTSSTPTYTHKKNILRVYICAHSTSCVFVVHRVCVHLRTQHFVCAYGCVVAVIKIKTVIVSVSVPVSMRASTCMRLSPSPFV